MKRSMRLLVVVIQWLAMVVDCRSAEPLPAVQMFVPGFVVQKLPVTITNLVNIEYSRDGRLFAAGYDGRIHLLRDSNGDGLEDEVVTFWDKTSADYPLGFLVHDQAVYVLLQRELVRFVDKDGDGVPETREVVLKDWVEPGIAEHPLILRRRVDYAMGLAIAPDGAIYIGMGNGAYNNAYMIDHEGKLGDKKKSHYDPQNHRGCVLKFSADGKKKELFVTGTRYLMCLQFNRDGDLFATDQEGATWLPNGNPFDELLQLQSGRHYGFPPRHPQYLPSVVDEPSVFDYAPQHQSVCGFRFNDRAVFGPSWWKDDALLAGFTRGKLYRTKLVKTDAGYVAQNQLIGALQSLLADVTISPAGDLVATSHTGNPDWGTGPSGPGLLYKIRYRDKNLPMPVVAWNAGPGEFRVGFDQRIDPKLLKDLVKQVRISAGKYVFAGDRFETIRPGYEVVKQQQAAARRDVPVLAAAIAADDRTLIVNTPTNIAAENYAITLPGFSTAAAPENLIAQEPAIDLLTDLHGVTAQWKSAMGQPTVTSWLPHVELAVAEGLTAASAEQQQFFGAIKAPGNLLLRGQLDLWEMLHPAIQPNAKLNYERSVEHVTVNVMAAAPFRMKFGAIEQVSTEGDGEHRISVKQIVNDNQWIPFEISLATTDQDPQLRMRWSTSLDPRPRAFPLRRFQMPWAVPASTTVAPTIDRRKMPEIAGGDRERGRRLFLGEANCSKCHQFRGEGTKIGPDLSNLVHRDYDSVMRDIHTPSAAINPDYLSYVVSLTDGRVVNGVINAETKESLRIADNTGKIIEINRAHVDEIVASKTSVMPEGLLKNLSLEQSRDLMTFLLLEPEKD